MAGGEHDCEWKERHEALTAQHVQLATQHQALAEKLNVLQHEFEKMKRQLLGPKSEKMPRVSDELRKDETADPAETKRKRRERSDSRKAHLECPLVARGTSVPTESSTAKLQLPGGVVLEFDAARVDPRWSEHPVEHERNANHRTGRLPMTSQVRRRHLISHSGAIGVASMRTDGSV